MRTIKASEIFYLMRTIWPNISIEEKGFIIQTLVQYNSNYIYSQNGIYVGETGMFAFSKLKEEETMVYDSFGKRYDDDLIKRKSFSTIKPFSDIESELLQEFNYDDVTNDTSNFDFENINLKHQDFERSFDTKIKLKKFNSLYKNNFR